MIQKVLRTAQNYLPGGRDWRETITRHMRRLRRAPHDPDLAALRYFPCGRLLLDVGGNYGQSIDSMLLMQPVRQTWRSRPLSAILSQFRLSGFGVDC
jgi:hypothetical protein